jgi:hypothetical protein
VIDDVAGFFMDMPKVKKETTTDRGAYIELSRSWGASIVFKKPKYFDSPEDSP